MQRSLDSLFVPAFRLEGIGTAPTRATHAPCVNVAVSSIGAPSIMK